MEIFPDRRNMTNSESSEQAFVCSIWNRFGILTKQQLLKMQDEELIARIILSAMFDKSLQPNDALLNEAYHGLSVVVIIIPPQKELSFIEDRVFVRKCSSTTEVTNAREIVALASNFSHSE